ncbi:hypothetical protein [Winogradskyella sp.]|uniref:hypothetical protein n=1 Tax=Winogradskyella sp. TaxID=1883156 RepID=UPI003AB1A663
MSLLDSLENLINKLRIEAKRRHSFETKYSLQVLGIDINTDFSNKNNEEVEQFLLKHSIKKKNSNGIVIWSNEYKKEVLNDLYLQVLDNIIGNVQLLIPELKHEFAAKKENEIDKILKKKLKGFNKNVNSHEGYLFFDEDYRYKTNNRLKSRFDVIWNINENYLKFPLTKRKEDALIISNAEYPFISFDIQQWCDFEYSFHLIPHFKEAIINESKNYDSLYALRSKKKQHIYNEYKHVFELFSSFNFTYETINNFNANVSSQIESLYQALLEKRLIVNQKTNFKKYLLNVHGITQPKIRDYKNLINYKHNDRVQNLKEKYDDFLKNS